MSLRAGQSALSTPKTSLFLALFFGAVVLSALPQTNSVRPTTTVAMGDMGGKLYGQAPDPAITRHYYIAAERQWWDFTPQARDVVCGMPLPPATLANHSSIKTRYVAYTDATFTRRERENPSLGILGPVLRGVVGENLAITFWNRTDVPLSMHPHGVKYDKDSEGSYYQPAPGLGAAVGPGAKFTYVWQMDASSGPSPAEPSSKAWLYHSHVSGDAEINMGLVGFIIVTDPKRARGDGTPIDVDRELGSLFLIFNESGFDIEAEETALAAAGPGGAAPVKSWAQIQERAEAGKRYAINGRIYGNLTGLEMNAGERVRWYMFALGSETDFHTAHWHGLRVREYGRSTDVIELLPASMKVADMIADNPGQWLFHCHVAEHMMGGMFAPVTVYSTENGSAKRAPVPALLGMPTGEQPLQVARAEAAVDFASGARRPCEIKMEGEVTVPEAFIVFNNPMRIQIGGHSITFKPGREGTDQNTGGSFQAEEFSRNSDDYGTVHGGRLKFTITLSGKAWLDELVAAGLKANSKRSAEIALPMSFETAGASYRATVQLAAAAR